MIYLEFVGVPVNGDMASHARRHVDAKGNGLTFEMPLADVNNKSSFSLVVYRNIPGYGLSNPRSNRSSDQSSAQQQRRKKIKQFECIPNDSSLARKMVTQIPNM
jgi:hypothetical protein